MDRKTAKKLHDEKVSLLMQGTYIDNDTQFDVIDEATTHIIDNFDPPEKMLYKRDHCLIIGAAHLGVSVENDNKQIVATTFFAVGDLHELSHNIALHMHQDKAFAHAIFHAIEVFALHDKPDNAKTI